jgi:hypothetical protein
MTGTDVVVMAMAVIRGYKPHGQRGLGCLGKRVNHGQNLELLRRELNPRGLVLHPWATRLTNGFSPAEFCLLNKAIKKKKRAKQKPLSQAPKGGPCSGAIFL